MIKTAKYFDQLPKGDLFVFISVRGTKIGRKIAPDHDILTRYRHNELTWEAFSHLYCEKLQKMWDEKNEALFAVAKFMKDPRTLWLVGWENEDNPHAPRHVLKKFLEEHIA